MVSLRDKRPAEFPKAIGAGGTNTTYVCNNAGHLASAIFDRSWGRNFPAVTPLAGRVGPRLPGLAEEAESFTLAERVSLGKPGLACPLL